MDSKSKIQAFDIHTPLLDFSLIFVFVLVVYFIWRPKLHFIFFKWNIMIFIYPSDFQLIIIGTNQGHSLSDKEKVKIAWLCSSWCYMFSSFYTICLGKASYLCWRCPYCVWFCRKIDLCHFMDQKTQRGFQASYC